MKIILMGSTGISGILPFCQVKGFHCNLEMATDKELISIVNRGLEIKNNPEGRNSDRSLKWSKAQEKEFLALERKALEIMANYGSLQAPVSLKDLPENATMGSAKFLWHTPLEVVEIPDFLAITYAGDSVGVEYSEKFKCVSKWKRYSKGSGGKFLLA